MCLTWYYFSKNIEIELCIDGIWKGPQEAKELKFWKTEGGMLPFPAYTLDFRVTWMHYLLNCRWHRGHNTLVPIAGHPPWVWWLSEVTTLLDKRAFPFLEDGEDHARLNKAERTGHKRDAGLSPLLCITLPQVLTSHQKAGLCRLVLTWRWSLVPLRSRVSPLPTKDLDFKHCKRSPHELAPGPSFGTSLIHATNTAESLATWSAGSLGLGINSE